jgi:hypothetical protein
MRRKDSGLVVLSQSEMLAVLAESKNIALVEPRYKRKYIPLGLANKGMRPTKD